jgi:two-component system, NtrC family, sensor histidine kinase PilS
MSTTAILRWVYLARLTLAAGIFAAALLVWTQPEVGAETTLLATLMLVTALGFTAVSFWRTHLSRHEPAGNFLYAQVLFDVVLVTAVVHVTGRGQSDFAALYVLVIAEGALLLPARGGVLVGALAALLYFADAAWGEHLTRLLGGVPQAADLDGGVLIRMALFALLAVVTVWMAERVRRAGARVGAVESELRQLQLDTGDILNALDTGVVTVDSEGRLAYINRAAESLLGIRSDAWLGRQVVTEMERIAPGLSAVVSRTLETGAPVNRYETHIRHGSELRVLGVRTTALSREEEPWLTMVMQDITDALQAETLRRRTERLEAVAELSASLAHEIKNPLASIRSAVEQLTRTDGGKLRKNDRDVLGGLVLTESDRLSRLLSGFIEYSRVEVRGRERLDLAAVAREAIGVARQHPEARGVTVHVEAAAPVEVDGDPDLLHRVVFNLVLNALQHSAEGDTVTVEVVTVEGKDLPAGVAYRRGARLKVRDQGPGVRPQEADRVFDPFFTTREGGGGLGLALVHRAVAAHDGMIFIDDTVEQGATFTVFLPASRAKGVTGGSEPNGAPHD